MASWPPPEFGRDADRHGGRQRAGFQPSMGRKAAARPADEAAGSERQGSEPTAAPPMPDPELLRRTQEAARRAGHEEGFAAGKAEGLAAGLEEARAAAAEQRQREASRLQDLLADVRTGFDGIEAQLERELLEVLRELTRRIIQAEMSARPDVLQGFLRRALEQARGDFDSARLHLSPVDLERWGSESLAPGAGFEISADPELKAGEVRVERGATRVLDSLGERLDLALAAMFD